MHLEVGPILQVRCAQVDMGGRSVCDPICDPVITTELRNPLESRISELQLRFLAESNRRKRFCRPVPNHSAKEPCVVCACKVTKFLPHTQAYDAESCARGGIKSKMRISKRDAHLIACLVSVERKTGLKPATLSLEG